MAVTGYCFPTFMLGLAASDITLPGGTWKIALSDVTGPVSLATSGIGTVQTFTDWKNTIAAEITGTGYTAGGVTVSSPTFSTSGGTVATFTTGTNPDWTSASFSANQAVLYQSSASGYQLGAFWDFGGAVTVTDGTFTLTVNADGLLTATV